MNSSLAEKTEMVLNAWYHSVYRFVTEALRIEPTDQQEKVLHAIKPGAHISVRSGHGVGKTALLSWVILWFLCTRFDARIPATASTHSQLRDILWPEIAKWISHLPAQYQNALEWQTERILWKDRRETWFAVARTARKEAPDALQGFHGENLMFIVDEAPGVPDSIFEVAEGAITKANAISILTGNPTRLSGEFYRSHNQDRHLWQTFHFSSVLSTLVSSAYADRIASKYGKDSDVYRVRVEGDFPLSESDTFIPLTLVEEARLRETADTGKVIWGVDPARFGDDSSALVKRTGMNVTEVSSIRKRDTMYVSGWVAQQAREEKPDRIMIDVIGIGAGVFDRLYELDFPVFAVNVAEKATNSEEYARLRDELWGNTKDALKEGLKLPDDEELLGQLSSPKYKFDSAGRFVIESKDDMKKRGVDSPDRADALCLSFYVPKLLYPDI
ncbi:MAG: terminase B [Candidatus Doudnabacteria bacterium]|nr:hypothetical protein [Desulfobacterales bacterium]MDZ4243840.1 terminase B [Candidatus Doudnabacteria bacterium]